MSVFQIENENKYNLNIFCDAVNGYGDISLTLKITEFLKKSNRFQNIKILFYLRNGEQNVNNVMSMIQKYELENVDNIFLYENEENDNENRMENFEKDMGCFIIIPQSNLTIDIYKKLCTNFNSKKECIMPEKKIGITEYNVEGYNIDRI